MADKNAPMTTAEREFVTELAEWIANAPINLVYIVYGMMLGQGVGK